jgi:exosome complex protein LRP1
MCRKTKPLTTLSRPRADGDVRSEDMADVAGSSNEGILASLIADGLPEDMATAVANFAAGVNDIEERVRRLQRTPWAELCRGLSPLESARLHLMVAYTINTLFYMYLKTQGITATNHPVMEELERVKTYIRKVKEVTKETEMDADASKRQLSLNASAAQRFIAHALGGPEALSTGGARTVARAASATAAEEVAAPEEEFDESFSQGVVERLDRERAAAAALELSARLEKLQQQTGDVSTGDAETDHLTREINDEVRRHAAKVNLPSSAGGKAKAVKAEGKSVKRGADGPALPKAKSKKDKKSARAMGER